MNTTDDTQTGSVDGLRRFLQRIRTATPDSFESVAAEALSTELGFSKVMFSWVKDATWLPIHVHVAQDLGDEFSDLVAAADGSPIPLFRAPREANLVRLRRPYLLERREFHRDAYRPLLDLADSTSYAAAPVVIGRRPIATLHADRQGNHLEDHDLRVLHQAARLCALSFASIDRLRRIAARREAALAMLTETLDRSPERGGFRNTPAPADTTPIRSGPALSAREREVLRLVASGATNRAIANELFITEHTVKSHVRKLFQELGVATRAGAAAQYREHLADSAASARHSA